MRRYEGNLTLKAARPYLRLYRGMQFVIKIDVCGAEMSVLARFLDQVALLYELGIQIVLVCGSSRGPVATQVRDFIGHPEVTIVNLAPDADADAIAASIAGKVAAEKLILCGRAPGLLERPGDIRSLVSYADLAGLRRIERSGEGHGETLELARSIRAALTGGVKRVHLISYSQPDSLLTEVFTNAGSGTLIVSDMNALTPAELQLLEVAS